jgi:hypothetical protein
MVRWLVFWLQRGVSGEPVAEADAGPLAVTEPTVGVPAVGPTQQWLYQAHQ